MQTAAPCRRLPSLQLLQPYMHACTAGDTSALDGAVDLGQAEAAVAGSLVALIGYGVCALRHGPPRRVLAAENGSAGGAGRSG